MSEGKRLVTLSAGSRGFDANTTINAATAKRFLDSGHSFAVRYVRRTTAHAFDITMTELDTIVGSGLALNLVQHVASPGWAPTLDLGKEYGDNAVDHAKAVGYLSGAHLWCDLEEVHKGSTPDDVAAYCNAWHKAVSDAGFIPGLYVGYNCGLSATELYSRLRFAAYWSAYNLNTDNVPAVRGVMMQQKPYPPIAQRVPCGFEYDVDVITVDAKGDTPILVAA
jgi:hypothetical protein